jgi:hypothetical protein
MEKLFYLWKMFFFHIAPSSSHKSFNGATPSGGRKISGGFMGHFIRWGILYGGGIGFSFS